MSIATTFPRRHAASWVYPVLAAFLFSWLALALGAPASGTGRSHGVMIPVRDSHGQPVRNERNQAVSSNWSGYALNEGLTGQFYTSASGTWVIPTAQAAPGYSYSFSSNWVGIGGLVDQSLIQLGTDSDSTPRGGSYYAWYEMLPAASVQTNLAVHPGDTIQGGLNVVGRNAQGQAWLLWMKNQTTGQLWYKVVAYRSSLLSAEWIVEAPYSGGILPLSNFGTATFDLSTVNGQANPRLNPSDSIVLEDPHGMSSNPSSPDSDTDGFSACWGPTMLLTACSAPGS